MDGSLDLAGHVYAQRSGEGVASFHFASAELNGSYISYESAAARRSLQPLDDGSPPPARKRFRDLGYNGVTRTLTATVSWAPTTWAQELFRVYLMVFDETFNEIITGHVRYYSRENKFLCQKRFGHDLLYRRLRQPFTGQRFAADLWAEAEQSWNSRELDAPASGELAPSSKFVALRIGVCQPASVRPVSRIVPASHRKERPRRRNSDVLWSGTDEIDGSMVTLSHCDASSLYGLELSSHCLEQCQHCLTCQAPGKPPRSKPTTMFDLSTTELSSQKDDSVGQVVLQFDV